VTSLRNSKFLHAEGSRVSFYPSSDLNWVVVDVLNRTPQLINFENNGC
jgi:glucokinase